jgi:hypothetical protein
MKFGLSSPGVLEDVLAKLRHEFKHGTRKEILKREHHLTRRQKRRRKDSIATARARRAAAREAR